MIKEVKGNYNPKELEQRIIEWWESNKIPNKLTKLDPKKKKFYLLDGPPYVNNIPHVGHIKTTTCKDIWSKFKLMQGFSSWFQPGFDTHGLPIENMVEKTLGITSKKDIEKMGIDKFIEACKKFATGNEKIWLELYKKLGAWRGYVEPYITYQNYYIESGWWTVKKLAEKGMLVEGEKSTFWCSHCQTALAGYEVSDSYADVKDPYIYVKFPVKGRKNEYIIAFTTTPWTLISNVALAVHPEEYYVRVKVGNEVYILAEKRVEPVLKDLLKIKYEILEKFLGKELDGLQYLPILKVPTQEKLTKTNAHRVILSIPVLKSKSYKHGLLENIKELKKGEFFDFVTVEEGSGVVHTAPGHGPEDHYIGEHYKLPMVSPIDDEGKFTEEAGEFKGIFVKDADKLIIERLQKNNLLLHFGWITHSYPLCWRCKTPLIYRLSKQWFFTIDLIKEQMIKENKKVNWLPSFGKERFHNWLDEAVDWCVSRQRYWGIPLPIWICNNCSKKEIIGSVEELKAKSATKLPKEIDLHKHVVDKIELICDNCHSRMTRVPDVLDVWFDSGISTWASLGYPYRNKEIFEKLWPADMVCESQDQIRGWFYSLMFCGVATFGSAPYNGVSLMGWVVDEKGEKMSKSLGNVIWAEDALEKLGADILRLYYCWEVAPWEVQNFSFKTAEEIRKALNILWNSYSFFTTYVTQDFKPTFRNLKIEDKWIQSKLHSLIKDVTNYLENFEFHNAGRKIIDFVVNDLSRTYIKLIRDRVWVSETGENKLAALSMLYQCLLTVSKLLAPITPFLSEEIYQNLEGKEKSVFMTQWPNVNEKLIDKELEQQMEIAKEIIEASLAARQLAGIKLRWPVSEILVQTDNENVIKVLDKLDSILLFMCNAKSIGVDKNPSGKEFSEVQFKYGKVYVNKTLDKELLEEALIKELIREVQNLRKQNKFNVKEKIILSIKTEKEIEKTVEKYTDTIKKEVGATKIVFGEQGNYKGKLNFEDRIIELSFDRV
ncbi:MAG: isoleucine--tRNA ligase [Candidatus Aenigmatarchaeota archaeon]